MNKFFNYLILILCTFTISITYAAEYEKSSRTKIIWVGAYHSSSASGDVLIRADKPSASCSSGYLLLEGTAGLNSSLSIAMSAFHSNSNVEIHAYTGKPWRGSSSSKWCIIEGIHLVK
jgi:D-arabinose 5-phosphate isomerase GutQ